MILELICILLGFLFFLFSQNPISKLAFVIFSFFCTGLLFINLDFSFVGIAYIIVYVGAIAILFLFVIMLVPTSLFFQTNTLLSSSFQLIGLLFLINLPLIYLFQSLSISLEFPLIHYSNWFHNYFDFTNIMNYALIFYHHYLFIIVMLAIILWVGLIGVLAISL